MSFQNITDKDIERGLWYIRNKKKVKKFIIIFLIVLSFCLFAFSIFKFIAIKVADSKDKNQVWVSLNFDSLKIKAEDLVVVNKSIINTGGDTYDIVVSIKNPNERFFAANVSYKFVYENGKSDTMQDYILPGQTKKLIDLKVKSPSVITDVNLEIANISWKKLRLQESEVPILKDIFSFENPETHFSEVESFRNWIGVSAINNSPYNFKKVDFYVFVYLGTELLAVDKVSTSNFYSQEKKYIESSWFYNIPNYVNLVVEADTNTIDKNNYINNK